MRHRSSKIPLKAFGIAAIAAFITTLLCCAGYVGYKAADEESCGNRQTCIDTGGDPTACHKRFRCKIRLDVRRRPI